MDEQPDQRPQFGNRFLDDRSKVFMHNAWDNVEWDEDLDSLAKQKVTKNSEVTFTSAEINEVKICSNTKWDNFYSIHQNRFFKDRHWLFTEFPELSQGLQAETSTNPTSLAQGINGQDLSSSISSEEMRKEETFPGEKSSFRILEVGCGVGNTVFPILEKNINSNLFIYCCDFSNKAIDIIKESENYDKSRCLAFVCDLMSKDWSTPFPQSSLDIIICIFVLSAVPPERMKAIVLNLSKYLKPGGKLLFRDYGRYDMAQLRFKKGRCLGGHFYARGDGTLCYFFTQDDVKEIMQEAGLEELQNVVDRRLQVNRGKKLTMYRVWIQAKYKKPKL